MQGRRGGGRSIRSGRKSAASWSTRVLLGSAAIAAASVAHAAGLGLFVRVVPSCLIRTTGRPSVACGEGYAPAVRVLTANGSEIYAGSSVPEAIRAAESVVQSNGRPYLVLDF